MNDADSTTPAPQPVAPLSYETPLSQRPPTDLGWHWEGTALVVPTLAVLPQRCVKCGGPGVHRYQRSLTWLNPLWLLTILVSWIVLVVIYFVLRKSGKVTLWLCDEHQRRRKKMLAIAWGIGLGGLAILIAGLVLLAADSREHEAASAISIIAGIAIAIVGLVVGNIGGRLVTPKKIDKQFMWLKGINPAVIQ